MLVLLLVHILALPVESLKILVMNPTIASSHVAYLGAIADQLVDSGHTVHMIVSEVDPKIKIFGSKKAQKVIFIPSPVDNAMNHIESRKNPFKQFSFFDPEGLKNVTLALEQMCNTTLFGRDKWMVLKDAEGYDIGISEIAAGYDLAVMHMLGVRNIVAASSLPTVAEFASSLFNVPAPPSFVPSGFNEGAALVAPNLSYWQRVATLFTYSITPYFMDGITKRQEEIARELDPSLPSLLEMRKNTSIMLVNIHPLLDFPRATSPRILYTGGLGINSKDAEPLDKEMHHILESSNKGNVLVSFGTYVRIATLDTSIFDAFLAAFARFPEYNFIWKFEGTEEQNHRVAQHKNVFAVKWANQKAILNHPRTKAFLSHMGVNSFMEGAFAGVPFIAMPLFIDQPYSAAQALRLGIASFLSKYDLTEQSIANAIDKALNDKSIISVSKRVASQLAEYTDDPAQRMIKHLEFVGKHGRIPTMDIPTVPFFIYYSLDVLIPALLSLIICCTLLNYVLLKLIRCICGKLRSYSHWKASDEETRRRKKL